MRVQAIRISYANAPKHVAGISSAAARIDAVIGKEYEVAAISIFQGVPSFQYLGESGFSDWAASWFFKVIDGAIPPDWICNQFADTEPSLVIGPPFMAASLDAYVRMVELEPELVKQFHDWLNQRKDEQMPH